MEICIDHVCESITILDHIIIPIPVCNDNFTLPGGDTVNGFLDDLGRKAGGTGVNLILEYLGLSVRMLSSFVNINVLFFCCCFVFCFFCLFVCFCLFFFACKFLNIKLKVDQMVFYII